MKSDDSSSADHPDSPRLVRSPDSGARPVSVDDALSDPPPANERKYTGGDVIADKYRLIRQVGEGGMGTVWVARNNALDVLVAIKLLRGQVNSDRQVNRLTQEARAAAQLGHPAIMRVFDFGTSESGDPFIVMELLHGESLAVVLHRRGCLSEKRSIQTLLPVVHALATAHDKGIVHRDLKPENIFLARTDAGAIQPKLVDFGIAKLQTEGFERLTRAGAVLGSPAYMSPEQARGEDVSYDADIWAVCVVLYEMITGAPPFHGDNYHGLLWSINHDAPTPTCTQVGGDAGLWDILEQGFRKDVRQRWQSIRELGSALAQWLTDNGVHEDIVGGSLKTAWLRRHHSGAEFLSKSASSQAPPTWARVGRDVHEMTTAPGDSDGPIQDDIETDEIVGAAGQPRPAPNDTRSKRKVVALAAGVVAAITIGAVVHTASDDDTTGTAPIEIPAVPAAAERPAPDPQPTSRPEPAPEPPEHEAAHEPVAPPNTAMALHPDAAPPTASAAPSSPPARAKRRQPSTKKRLKNPFR